MYFSHPNFKATISRKISGIFSRFDKTNRLIFLTNDKESSKRYRAIMHYVSKLNDKTVKTLCEITDYKFSRRTEDYEETKNSTYRVDQSTTFIIDRELGIEGKVYTREKEKSEYNGKTNYTEYNYLEIFSKKINLIKLEEWVEKRLDEFNAYLKAKNCDKQLLVEVSWNPKDKDIDIYYNPWESNVTFENRFFTNKNEILNKINFFINNPEWYKKRGIPYTIGFLLWGEPGCGKTGFIKALMNLTGRHGVSIKLNSKFDMNKLREIIYDDEIYEDLIIPQQNRILIFEDIDCMGDVVKDRDIKEKEKEKEKEQEDGEENRRIKKKKFSDDDTVSIVEINNQNENNFNNNLSYFLNILDGLQECPGRIIIMTTNKPENLDKALVRPGRIDYNINFTKATKKDVIEIMEFYWGEKIDDLPQSVSEKYSHAEVVNFCRTSETINETIQKLTSKLL
jgi:ATP-dependent 26S proteasome regulatory subunit